MLTLEDNFTFYFFWICVCVGNLHKVNMPCTSIQWLRPLLLSPCTSLQRLNIAFTVSVDQQWLTAAFSVSVYQQAVAHQRFFCLCAAASSGSPALFLCPCTISTSDCNGSSKISHTNHYLQRMICWLIGPKLGDISIN